METSEIGIILNSATKPSASLHDPGYFLQLQRRDGHDATAMQNEWSVLRLSGTWMLGIPLNGFPRQTCRTSLVSAVRHILQTSAADRLAAPLQPTVAKSSISTHCNSRHGKWEKNTFQSSVTNFGDHNSVTKPMLFCIWHKSGIFDKEIESFASIVQA